METLTGKFCWASVPPLSLSRAALAARPRTYLSSVSRSSRLRFRLIPGTACAGQKWMARFTPPPAMTDFGTLAPCRLIARFLSVQRGWGLSLPLHTAPIYDRKRQRAGQRQPAADGFDHFAGQWRIVHRTCGRSHQCQRRRPGWQRDQRGVLRRSYPSRPGQRDPLHGDRHPRRGRPPADCRRDGQRRSVDYFRPS